MRVTGRRRVFADVVRPAAQRVGGPALGARGGAAGDVGAAALHVQGEVGGDLRAPVVVDHVLLHDQRALPNAVRVRTGVVLAFGHVDRGRRRARRERAAVRARHGAVQGVEAPARGNRALVHRVGLEVRDVGEDLRVRRGSVVHQGEVGERRRRSRVAEARRAFGRRLLDDGDRAGEDHGVGRERPVLVTAAAVEIDEARVVRRARDGDCRVGQPPVGARRDMAGPREDRVGDGSRELDRDLGRLVADEAGAVGIRVGADAGDRAAVEPEVPGDGGDSRAGDLRVGGDGERVEGGRITPAHAEARICGRNRLIDGRDVVERVLGALRRVPLDRHRVRGEREVVEPQAIGKGVAFEVHGLARADVAVHPVAGARTTAVGVRRRGRVVGALVDVCGGIGVCEGGGGGE